jgi:tetratricopeptide (TPR) repeat protein
MTNNHGKSPQGKVDLAKAAEERAAYAEALDIWRTLATESDDPVALCHEGRLSHQLGYTEESRQAYYRAIHIDPSLPRPYIGLAIAYIHEGLASEAVPLLKKALTLEKSASIYSLLGAAFKDLDRNSEASECFEAALRIDPSYEEAYFNLGVLTKDSDPKQAEAFFLEAVTLDPDYAPAHRELGWLLSHTEPGAQAEYHLRRALELNPSDSWGRIYLGNLLWARGDVGGAIKEYECAIELMPDEALPLWSLANVYENQELWDQAEALYEKAVTLDPNDGIARMNFGRMLGKKGDPIRAKIHLERALSIDPHDEKARRLLADLE